jgi:hypothetical protein
MYENPEIMRQLVNDRLDERRGNAAERRLAATTHRRGLRRTRFVSRFTALPSGLRSPARKPATA